MDKISRQTILTIHMIPFPCQEHQWYFPNGYVFLIFHSLKQKQLICVWCVQQDKGVTVITTRLTANTLIVNDKIKMKTALYLPQNRIYKCEGIVLSLYGSFLKCSTCHNIPFYFGVIWKGLAVSFFITDVRTYIELPRELAWSS